MIEKLFQWAGWPGVLLIAALVIGLSGSVATILIGAPCASIPFFDLFALLLAPFPSLACYGVAACLVFIVLRSILGLLIQRPLLAQWTAGAVAILATASAGIGLPKFYNFEAGIRAPSAQQTPAAISLARGGEVALIGNGQAPYVRCGSICLSLLVQGQADAVLAADTTDEPQSLATLPGKRFTLTTQTRACLVGKRDYTVGGWTSDARHENFIQIGAVPIEYDRCLDVQNTVVDPARQPTFVEWTGDLQTQTPKVGYFGPVNLVRTVMPSSGGLPIVHEARYRSGWMYDDPLFIWPYGGNAGSGSYFEPLISISYFREPGFPDVLSPRFWRLIQGSESMGQKTAIWLDGVVARSRAAKPAPPPSPPLGGATISAG